MCFADERFFSLQELMKQFARRGGGSPFGDVNLFLTTGSQGGLLVKDCRKTLIFTSNKRIQNSFIMLFQAYSLGL